MAKLEPLNLGSIAHGAALELFNLEIAKVAANINDKSTSATAEREIVLRFKFKPDDERRRIDVTTSAKSSLASVEKHASRVYLGRDEAGTGYLFDSDPRQEMLFQPPAEEPQHVIQFKQPS